MGKRKKNKGLPQAAPAKVPEALAEKAMSMKDVVEALAKITDRPEDFWVNGIAIVSKMEQGVAYVIEPASNEPKFFTCPNCERRFVYEPEEEPEAEAEGATENESEEE